MGHECRRIVAARLRRVKANPKSWQAWVTLPFCAGLQSRYSCTGAIDCILVGEAAKGPMPTFFIEQFGCRATQADGAALERQLLQRGCTSSSEPGTADFVVGR